MPRAAHAPHTRATACHDDLIPCLSQDVSIKTDDGVDLHGWLLWGRGWSKEEIKSRPVVMFFQVLGVGRITRINWLLVRHLTFSQRSSTQSPMLCTEPLTAFMR